MVASIIENVQLFEYQQYKLMFNSLQEGVLVVNTPKVDVAEVPFKDCRLFFANELMQVLMNKLLGIPTDLSKEESIQTFTKSINRKFIWQYKSEAVEQRSKAGSQRSRCSRSLSSHRSRVAKGKSFSIYEILKLSQNQLSKMVFMFSDKRADLLKDQAESTELQAELHKCKLFKKVEKELVPKYRFFQIKKSEDTETYETQNRFTIQFIDISADIFYDEIKAQEEFMNITTSTISHEMRNPLNSIISQCRIMESFIHRAAQLFAKIRNRMTAQEAEEADEIQEVIKKSNETQKTSSQLLLFNVEDILGIAQIRAAKFTKIIKSFDLEKALREVISVQAESANSKGVLLGMRICTDLVQGFKMETSRLMVLTDKKRLQQILINLQSNAIKFTRSGGSVEIIVHCLHDKRDQIAPQTE